MKTTIYVRFSNREQAEGASTTRQLRDCRKMSADLGWDVVSEIHDKGRSAFTGANRDNGAALGQFIEETLRGDHQGEALVVERLDRLSRQGFEDTYSLLKLFRASGVTVGTFDGREVYGVGDKLDQRQIMLMLLLGERAHEESATKAQRVRDGKAEARRKAREEGRTITRMVPPWIAVVNGTRTVIEERAEVVRHIFGLADEGMGRTRIVRWLHEHGIAPWGVGLRVSQGWHESFITRLLRNPAVLGEFQPHEFGDGRRVAAGSPILGYFPPIVPADLFERVNRGASSRKQAMGHRRSEKIANLISGLAKCATCGSTMRYRERAAEGSTRTVSGKRYQRTVADASLVCSAAMRRHAGCENRSTIAYHRLEGALLDAVLHLALDDKAFSDGAELSKLRTMVAERERAAAHSAQRAEVLWKAVAASPSAMAERLARSTEAEAMALRNDVGALKDRISVAEGKASSAEHLRRVGEVRDNLYHPDLQLRVPLRRKTAQGLRSVITTILCREDRSALVSVAGGLVVFMIKSGVVHGLDQQDTIKMLSSSAFRSARMPEVQRQRDEIMTRMKRLNGDAQAA